MAIPVVSQSNKKATLGTVIAQMESQGDWAFPTDQRHEKAMPSDVLLGMMRALWAGQGRHAGQPDYAPNSRAAAEAAVLLAVPLVQWFASGVVTRAVVSDSATV